MLRPHSLALAALVGLAFLAPIARAQSPDKPEPDSIEAIAAATTEAS